MSPGADVVSARATPRSSTRTSHICTSRSIASSRSSWRSEGPRLRAAEENRDPRARAGHDPGRLGLLARASRALHPSRPRASASSRTTTASCWRSGPTAPSRPSWRWSRPPRSTASTSTRSCSTTPVRDESCRLPRHPSTSEFNQQNRETNEAGGRSLDRSDRGPRALGARSQLPGRRQPARTLRDLVSLSARARS